MAATTEPARASARPRSGPDRLTLALLTLSAFLAVLALLISQLRTTPVTPRTVVVRKVYRTTVVETVLGQRAGGTSVSRSTTSAGGGASALPAPTTRVS